MPARPAHRPPIFALVTSVLLGAFLVATIAVGCSYDRATDDKPPSFTYPDSGAAPDAQVIEVGGDDAPSPHRLCGVESHCDPDREDICTPRDAGAFDAQDAGDADADDGDAPIPEDSGDAPMFDVIYDSVGSGSQSACRVVKSGNNPITQCAPAGVGPVDSWCRHDADCRPGFTCAGAPPARCLRFCCGATAEADPCRAEGRYCTPLPLADLPDEKVPVCVQPDHCKLLADDTTCQKGDTCTVVTKFGDTTCIPVGNGRDLGCCPCDRGYVCLGTAEDRRCRKLCHDGVDTECAGGGSCQKLPSIPDGFGICSIGDAGAPSGDGGACPGER